MSADPSGIPSSLSPATPTVELWDRAQKLLGPLAPMVLICGLCVYGFISIKNAQHESAETIVKELRLQTEAIAKQSKDAQELSGLISGSMKMQLENLKEVSATQSKFVTDGNTYLTAKLEHYNTDLKKQKEDADKEIARAKADSDAQLKSAQDKLMTLNNEVKKMQAEAMKQTFMIEAQKGAMSGVTEALERRHKDELARLNTFVDLLVKEATSNPPNVEGIKNLLSVRPGSLERAQ